MGADLITLEMEDGFAITYLTVPRVVHLYAEIFECTDQQAEGQLRDKNGLVSALTRPQTHAFYEGADIPQQAAVLAHGIAEGQPFFEGNKKAPWLAS
jgi:prophage maintenance system killer protein